MLGCFKKYVHTKALLKHMKGRDHFGHTSVGEKIILKWVTEKGWKMWTGFIWLRVRSNEYDNETFKFHKR
jgi:hypothetical protein